MKSPLGKGAAKIAGGGAIGQLCLFLAIPILTRLYSPEDYGVFVAASAFVAVSGTVSALRVDSLISVVDDDYEASCLVKLVALVSVVAGVLAAGVFVAYDGMTVTATAA